jgi:uncharacterized cupin superfamily protein
VQHLAHWDDVEPRRREAGHIGGTWRDLGSAAGTSGVGVQLVDIDPGRWSTPAHIEGAEEEISYVLAGSGLSWQDRGEGGVAYPVRAGDCIVHLPLREAHTLHSGPDGLRVLAFGQRIGHGNTLLPRAGVAWASPAFLEVAMVSGRQGPFLREAAVGEPEVGELMERPASIVNVDELPGDTYDEPGYAGVGRNLGRAAGSAATGISHVVLEPDALSSPLHCHSAEEEIFVVLDGAGTLLLGGKEHPLRPGHVVGRPPGTRVAHALRAGEPGLTYLAYGTREPNDIAYYPRSGKVYFRGVGLMTRVEQLDYWDGEL